MHKRFIAALAKLSLVAFTTYQAAGYTGNANARRPEYDDPNCIEEMNELFARECWCGGGGIFFSDPMFPQGVKYQFSCKPVNWDLGETCEFTSECDIGKPVEEQDPWQGGTFPYFAIWSKWDLCWCI